MYTTSKTQLATIIVLTVAIISGSYGIVSFLQYKSNKKNTAESVFYQKCSTYLKGQDSAYCDVFKS